MSIVFFLAFSACVKEKETYLFHFTTAYKCGSDSSMIAAQEIQAKVDFDKTYSYTSSREDAISSAQREFDQVISTISGDYSEYFGADEYVSIGMAMFAPDSYVVDEKTWGNK